MKHTGFNLSREARCNSGYTLIEMAVVVGVILIIGLITIPLFINADDGAHDLEAKTALDQSIKSVDTIATQAEMTSYEQFGTATNLTSQLAAYEPRYPFVRDSGNVTTVGTSLIDDTVYLARMSRSGKCFIVRRSTADGVAWAVSNFHNCNLQSVDPFLVWEQDPDDAEAASLEAGLLGDVPFLCNDDQFVETDEDCADDVLPAVGDDPTDSDDDDDGIDDDDENVLGTDPLDADSDNDGVDDGTEVDNGTDPLDADTDNDDADDGTEEEVGSDPLDPDTDGDGYTDGEEIYDTATPPVLDPPADDTEVTIDGITVTSDSNPNISQVCGVNAVLVLDESGSIGSNRADVRDAAWAYVQSALNADSKLAIVEFNSQARLVTPLVLVTDANIDMFEDYLFNRSGGFGDGYDPTEYSNSSALRGTNYDAAFTMVGDLQAAEAIHVAVFVTDGIPTFHLTDEPGDATDSYYNTVNYVKDDFAGDGTSTDVRTLTRGVDEANRVKANGTHIIGVGVGDKFQDDGQDNLIAIAGPDVAAPGEFNPHVDDVIVADTFTDLASVLNAAEVFGTCGASSPTDPDSTPFDSDADNNGIPDGAELATSNVRHCGANGNGRSRSRNGDRTRGSGNCKGTSTGNNGESENPVVDPNDELLIDSFSRTGQVGGSTPETTYDAGQRWDKEGSIKMTIYDGVAFSKSRRNPATVIYDLDTTQAIMVNLDLVPRGRPVRSPSLDLHAYVGLGDSNGASVQVGVQMNASPTQPDWIVVSNTATGDTQVAELPQKIDPYTPIKLQVRVEGTQLDVLLNGAEILSGVLAPLDGDDQYLWLQAPGIDSGLPGIDNVAVELMF